MPTFGAFFTNYVTYNIVIILEDWFSYIMYVLIIISSIILNNTFVIGIRYTQYIIIVSNISVNIKTRTSIINTNTTNNNITYALLCKEKYIFICYPIIVKNLRITISKK